MSAPPFLVQITYRPNAGRKAGHIIAFVTAPEPGRNAFRPVHGPEAYTEAERFPSPEAAEAALATLPDSPNRIDYEIAPEADFARTHAST